ncbi:MAG: hypothetical protein FWE07_01385 [Turicibacter sp.]|nr:hypothetical protein [Turicibacter sp.]
MFEKLTRFETSDQTTPPTAYYKGTYEQVKTAVFEAAKKINMEVKSHNNDHKEFLLKRGRVEVMVTAYSITLLETAVDVVVMTPLLAPGKKIAVSFFEAMKPNLQMK